MYEILGYADVYMTSYLVDNNYVTPSSDSGQESYDDTSAAEDEDYEVDISAEAYRLAEEE